MKRKRLNSLCVKFKIGLLTPLAIISCCVTALGGDVLAVSAGDSVQQIIGPITYYLPSYVILTKYGKVYTYGVNVDGRIGNGTTCGDYNEVFSKLDNMLGDDEDLDDITLDDIQNLGEGCFYGVPQDITGLFNGDRIRQIGVGYSTPAGFKGSAGFVALGESGTMYTWGGLSGDSGAPVTAPTKVDLPNELDIEHIDLVNGYGLGFSGLYPLGKTSDGKWVFCDGRAWWVSDYSGLLPDGAVVTLIWQADDNAYLATTDGRVFKINFDDIEMSEREVTLGNGNKVIYTDDLLVDDAKYEDVTDVYSPSGIKDAIYGSNNSLALSNSGSLYFGDDNLTTKYNLPLVDELLSEYSDYSSGDGVDYTLVKTNDGHVLGIPYIDKDGVMSKEIRYYDDLFTGSVEHISVTDLNGNYAYTTKEMPNRVNVSFAISTAVDAPVFTTYFDIPLENEASGIDNGESLPGAPAAGLQLFTKNSLIVLSVGSGIAVVLGTLLRRRKIAR